MAGIAALLSFHHRVAEAHRFDAHFISTFATHVSHELKSPLTSIQGATKLTDAVASLRSSFAALDIRASGDIDMPVRMSEENAMIILSNLADNATRHGGTVFDLSATRQGTLLVLNVSDNGEGVSPNNRTRIFDSFFTTRRDSGGTGMGLAIVRAVLQAHGGTIRLADSEAGAAFEVTMPIADSALS